MVVDWEKSPAAVVGLGKVGGLERRSGNAWIGVTLILHGPGWEAILLGDDAFDIAIGPFAKELARTARSYHEQYHCDNRWKKAAGRSVHGAPRLNRMRGTSGIDGIGTAVYRIQPFLGSVTCRVPWLAGIKTTSSMTLVISVHQEKE